MFSLISVIQTHTYITCLNFFKCGFIVKKFLNIERSEEISTWKDHCKDDDQKIDHGQPNLQNVTQLEFQRFTDLVYSVIDTKEYYRGYDLEPTPQTGEKRIRKQPDNRAVEEAFNTPGILDLSLFHGTLISGFLQHFKVLPDL